LQDLFATNDYLVKW